MVKRRPPPSVGDTMITRAGCAMIVVVAAIAGLAQWGWNQGHRWVLVVALLAAPLFVVLLNRGRRPPPRPPKSPDGAPRPDRRDPGLPRDAKDPEGRR